MSREISKLFGFPLKNLTMFSSNISFASSMDLKEIADKCGYSITYIK